MQAGRSRYALLFRGTTLASSVRLNGLPHLMRRLHSLNGPVARDLQRRGLRVESQAKINASGRPGPNVITGRLRSSIHTELGVDEQGLYARVGSNVVYAGYVENLYPYLRPALSAAGS